MIHALFAIPSGGYLNPRIQLRRREKSRQARHRLDRQLPPRRLVATGPAGAREALDRLTDSLSNIVTVSAGPEEFQQVQD